MLQRRCVCFTMAALALAGCDAAGPGPAEVAQRFWSALEAERFAEARQSSTAPGEQQVRDLARLHRFASLELGEVLRNENAALVETNAVLEGSRETRIQFNTRLARFDGAWRVELEETRRELVRAQLASTVEDVKETLHESAEIITDTIERGALEFSEALREAMEDFERDLKASPAP